MNARRDEYLKHLGIEVYVPRETPTAALDTVTQAPEREGAALEARRPVTVAAPEGAGTGALDWAGLERTVAACTLCSLHSTRTQTVFGVGNRQADLLVIGEAPGAEEDARGEPFVGRAGQLLNSMLKAIGLDREQVFIANILKCRPPGNRDPKPEEAAHCRPYLERQIGLLSPKVILAVGRIAAQNLLATETPIGRLRGRVYTFGRQATPLVVTYHPAYLLRSPGEKRKAWSDLKLAQETLARGRGAS